MSLACVGLGCVAFLSPLRTALAGALPSPARPRGARIIVNHARNPADTLLKRQDPKLSTAQQAAALAIVRHTPGVSKFVTTIGRVAHVGPWTSETGAPIGEVLFVDLTHARTVKRTWAMSLPYANRLYEEHATSYTAKGATSVLIQVDLTRRLVVGLTPLDAASVTKPHPAPISSLTR